MFWQPAERPASTFPPRPSTPPPDSNNVSKCSSARRWMGTLLNTTCHLSNPRLVTGGEERQSSNLRCLWWEEGLDACWASETIFLWFGFTCSNGNCTPGVFATLCICVWWCARYQVVLQKAKALLSFKNSNTVVLYSTSFSCWRKLFNLRKKRIILVWNTSTF